MYRATFPVIGQCLTRFFRPGAEDLEPTVETTDGKAAVKVASSAKETRVRAHFADWSTSIFLISTSLEIIKSFEIIAYRKKKLTLY